MAEVEETPNLNVFIGGLSSEVTLDSLTAHLTSKGVTVSSLSMFEHADGRSKNCALAVFGSAEDAAAAITAVDETELSGKTMSARVDRGSRAGRPRNQPRNEDPTLIYVGNLADAATEENISPVFAQYGTVVEVSIHKKRRAEQSQGWCTVQFASAEEAAAALSANGSDLLGVALVVEELKSGPRPKREPRERKPRQPRKAREPKEDSEEAELPPAGSLHIGNLAWSVTDEDLTTLFTPYGEVESVEIARDKRTDKSRGWGSIRMATAEQADAALAAINGTHFHERDLDVQIKAKLSRTRTRKPRTRRAADGEDDEEGGGRRRRRRNKGDNEEGGEPRQPRERKKREPKERKEPEPVAVPNPECFLYVGNLAWDATGEGVKELFSSAGTVTNATITMTKRSREDRSRGWGTVEMSTGEEAQAAIAQFHDSQYMERSLLVRSDTRVVKQE